MSEDEVALVVDRAVQQLREFFPMVQVLVSWNDEGGTHDLFRGSGNWYARVGMAREFLNRDEGQTTAKEVADALRKES